MPVLVTLLLIVFAVYLSGIITALIHELGHAVAYLVLASPSQVDIFIGSYGDRQKSFNFRIGKLRIFIKRMFPFVRPIGCCYCNLKMPSAYRNIAMLVAGSAFTCFFAMICTCLVFQFDLHGALKFLCVVFIIYSLVSLYYNLMPFAQKDNTSYDTDSDGILLMKTFKLRRVYPSYSNALTSVYNGNYQVAFEGLKKALLVLPENDTLLALAATCTLHLRDFENASAYFDSVALQRPLSSFELLSRGTARSYLKERDAAIADYRCALIGQPDHIIALNNLSYELIETGKYDEAESLLRHAYSLESDYSYTNANSGYLQLKRGEFKLAFDYITKSIELAPSDVYHHIFLAKYYIHLKEVSKAEKILQKCYELDPTIDLSEEVDELQLLRQGIKPNRI
jgi:tetratricopeptide (TPR) repeat protein